MLKIIKKLMKKATKKVVKPIKKVELVEPTKTNEEIYLGLSKRQRRRQRKTLGM